MSESQPTPPPADAPLSDEVRKNVELYQKAFREFLESRGIESDAPEKAAAKESKVTVEITSDGSTTSKAVQLPLRLEELLATVYDSTPIVVDKLTLSIDKAVIRVKQDAHPGQYQTRDDQIFNMDHIDEPGYATKIEFDFNKGVHKTGRGFPRDAMTKEERVEWTETPLKSIHISEWRLVAKYADHIPNTQARIINDRPTHLPPVDMPSSFKMNSVNKPTA
jgi:hypothetical protein